ncbi:MAG TPA: carboxymuconolactone decarboxylase family protein [Lacipirellulaceae bacterium]|nr:carboxymuconolactone decarboxylase family protein [Lacipirellulaceae bacterium]
MELHGPGLIMQGIARHASAQVKWALVGVFYPSPHERIAMTPRIDAAKVSPEPQRAMYAIEKYLASCGLEHGLRELVKLRASQINGCAYCIDMHWKDARAAGETEQRLYALNAWRESPFYTDRERAALAWTEAVTLVTGGVPDDVYEAARQHFDEQELVDLTWAVAAINAWNRMAISFRAVPGAYQPPRRPSLQPATAST